MSGSLRTDVHGFLTGPLPGQEVVAAKRVVGTPIGRAGSPVRQEAGGAILARHELHGPEGGPGTASRLRSGAFPSGLTASGSRESIAYEGASSLKDEVTYAAVERAVDLEERRRPGRRPVEQHVPALGVGVPGPQAEPEHLPVRHETALPVLDDGASVQDRMNLGGRRSGIVQGGVVRSGRVRLVVVDLPLADPEVELPVFRLAAMRARDFSPHRFQVPGARAEGDQPHEHEEEDRGIATSDESHPVSLELSPQILNRGL